MTSWIYNTVIAVAGCCDLKQDNMVIVKEITETSSPVDTARMVDWRRLYAQDADRITQVLV